MMETENTDLDPDGQDPETPAPQNLSLEEIQREWQKDKRTVGKVRKERDELEKQLRSERFARLQKDHPWLEPEDLEGVGFDKWEAKVGRLAAIAGKPTDAPSEAAETASKPSKPPSEVVSQTQRLAASAGGEAPAAPQPMSKAELQARMRHRGEGRIGLEEWKQLKQEGRLPT